MGFGLILDRRFSCSHRLRLRMRWSSIACLIGYPWFCSLSLSLLPWLTFLSWSKDQFIDCLHSIGMLLTSLLSVVGEKARFLGFDDKSWSELRFSQGAPFQRPPVVISLNSKRTAKERRWRFSCDALFKFTILGFASVERGRRGCLNRWRSFRCSSYSLLEGQLGTTFSTWKERLSHPRKNLETICRQSIWLL